MNNILSLFQLCDSNFPTGAFSHSYGLESYIQEDKVHDQATFLEWLRGVFKRAAHLFRWACFPPCHMNH